MNIERLCGVCAAVVLFASMAPGQAQPVRTVEELIRIALDRNQDYLASKERVAEAEALARQAGQKPAPTLEVEVGTGAITGSHGESEYSATYFHTLERGGKREKRMAVAENGIELARAELQERERHLTFDVKSHAIALLTQELKLTLVRSILGTSQDSYRLTTQRVTFGDAAPLEAQLLLSDVNRTQAQIISLESVREAALVDLRSVAGLTPAQSIDLDSQFQLGDREPRLEELQAYALENRRDLYVLKLLEEQASAELSLADAETRRDVTALARYTHSNTSIDVFNDTDNILTFGVSIPLFTKNRAQPAMDAARSRQTQQALRREQLTRTIPQEVEAAYRRWIGARRSLDLLKSGVIEPSQGSLTVIREAYRLGQLRLFDVLSEQRRIADLQISFIDAQSDAARSLAELERTIGGNLP